LITTQKSINLKGKKGNKQAFRKKSKPLALQPGPGSSCLQSYLLRRQRSGGSQLEASPRQTLHETSKNPSENRAGGWLKW
jgi:hypothetical protein